MTRMFLTAVLIVLASTAAAQAPPAVVERGEAAFKRNGCYGCHIIGKFGTPIGPELSAVGRKYPQEYLVRWLRDPAQQRPSAHMPTLELTEQDIAALAAYLASLR
jgi:mono/diheme cytochrome c family protein